MSAADDLTTTLAALWPGAQVRPGRTGQALAAYALVPSATRPRLLVPAHGSRAAARSVLRFSTDSSPRDVTRRFAAAAWLGVGGAARLPRVSVVGEAASSLQAYLGTVLGTAVTFSLGVGTARVNRKPVLQVFDPSGRTLAFAKLGVTEQSRRDVTAEAAALRRLETWPWHTFEPPRVLHLGTWDDVLVLVLAPLPSRPRVAPPGLHRPPLAAMHELERVYALLPRPLDDLPWLGRIRTVADGLRDRSRAALLDRCLEALVTEADGREVALGAWHGDWTPWNMSPGRARVRVWDWERFETGVPTGMDAVHFDVNARTRARGTSTATVLDALVRSGPSAPERGTDDHLRAGLYLLAVSARYLPLAEGLRGRDITARSTCFLDALATWSGVPQGSRGSTGEPTAASR